MYSFSYSTHLTCEKVYKNSKDCDIKNIYQHGQNTEKHPELKKNDPIDFEAFIKSRSDSEGQYTYDLDLFLGIVALHLKANHFSDDFIENVIVAAKEGAKQPPNKEELDKSLKEVYEALGISAD